MNAPDPSPLDVGRQLQQRREELDLTQQQLAQRLSISARTVSAVERGLNQITKSKRSLWEEVLGLVSGTISRAYRDGSPVETAPARAGEPPGGGHVLDPDAERRRFAKQVAAELVADIESGLEEAIMQRLAEMEERQRRESG